MLSCPFWKTIAKIDFTGPWAVPENMLFLSNHAWPREGKIKSCVHCRFGQTWKEILRPFINNKLCSLKMQEVSISIKHLAVPDITP